jgi:fatty acid desaturase
MSTWASDSQTRRAAHLSLDEVQRRRLYTPVPGAVLRAFAGVYLGIIVTFTLALWAHSPAAYVAAFIIAVAVQTHLAVLMHEGAHWLLHPDKATNDRLTNWLAAFPIGTTVAAYRCNHLRHHTYLGTPDDPDFVALGLPPIRAGLAASVLGCLSGARHLRLLVKYYTQARTVDAQQPVAPSGLAGRLLWHGGLFGIAAWAGQPWAYVLVWLLPLATFGVLINEVRSIVEHTPLIGPLAPGGTERLEPTTRTVVAGWLGRLWIGPLNFHYHLEHHLYPGVPFSRLPDMHAALRASGYYTERPDLLYDGYRPILAAVWRRYRQPQSRPEISIEDGVYVARRA